MTEAGSGTDDQNALTPNPSPGVPGEGSTNLGFSTGDVTWHRAGTVDQNALTPPLPEYPEYRERGARNWDLARGTSHGAGPQATPGTEAIWLYDEIDVSEAQLPDNGKVYVFEHNILFTQCGDAPCASRTWHCGGDVFTQEEPVDDASGLFNYLSHFPTPFRSPCKIGRPRLQSARLAFHGREAHHGTSRGKRHLCIAEQVSAAGATLIRRLLLALVSAVCRYPLLVLLVSLGLCGLSVYAACTRLQYHTQRNDLISPKKDYQQRWQQYLDEFGDDDDIVVVVRGQDRPRMEQALEAVAQRIGAIPTSSIACFTRSICARCATAPCCSCPWSRSSRSSATSWTCACSWTWGRCRGTA